MGVGVKFIFHVEYISKKFGVPCFHHKQVKITYTDSVIYASA